MIYQSSGFVNPLYKNNNSFLGGLSNGSFFFLRLIECGMQTHRKGSLVLHLNFNKKDVTYIIEKIQDYFNS